MSGQILLGRRAAKDREFSRAPPIGLKPTEASLTERLAVRLGAGDAVPILGRDVRLPSAGAGSPANPLTAAAHAEKLAFAGRLAVAPQTGDPLPLFSGTPA